MTTEQELNEIREIVEENNRMLKGLRSRARISTTVSVIKWVVFVGIALGIYTYIQPFLLQVVDTYSSIKENATTIQDIKNNTPNLKDLFNI